MGWTGSLIGCLLGGLRGGFLGSLLGSVAGHYVEEFIRSHGGRDGRDARADFARGPRRSMVFCASAAAMLAKLAKADGRVTEDEIAAVEQAFARLGFEAQIRDYAVSVFRKAKDDAHTIYEYAREFAASMPAVEVRELFYGLLWDLARADGVVSAAEREILRRIPDHLAIRSGWYGVYDRASAPREETLDDAYAALDVSPAASDADVKRAYREKAKKYHPDALRAQGLPDEMIGRATEQMARINAAWARIRSARGI